MGCQWRLKRDIGCGDANVGNFKNRRGGFGRIIRGRPEEWVEPLKSTTLNVPILEGELRGASLTPWSVDPFSFSIVRRIVGL